MDANNTVSNIALLMDDYSSDSERLHRSFKLSNIDVLPIVIAEDGFLPDDVMSVYGFFLGKFEGSPRYFNKLNVPDYWEIKSTNANGQVMDMGVERARIFYRKPYNKRIVRLVEWLDDKGFVRSGDHYNKYGAIYARTIYNAKGQKVNKSYFNAKGQEVIVENFVTNDIILNYENKTAIFKTKTDFIINFFIKAKLKQTRLFYNSLSTPFFVSQKLHTRVKKDVLFWQEPSREDIPGNMKIILDGNATRTEMIMVQNKRSYEKLMSLGASGDRLKRFGYVYDFIRDNHFRKDILICTNSDRISHIEELATKLSDCRFHIAAITEMSSKLMAMGKYSNVRLYPGIKDKRLDELFENCDYYLDINYQSEIMLSVTKAFLNNQLIFAFKDTIHNYDYIADEHIFDGKDVDKMIEVIKETTKDEQCLKEHIMLQHEQALSVGEADYAVFV